MLANNYHHPQPPALVVPLAAVAAACCGYVGTVAVERTPGGGFRKRQRVPIPPRRKHIGFPGGDVEHPSMEPFEVSGLLRL